MLRSIRFRALGQDMLERFPHPEATFVEWKPPTAASAMHETLLEPQKEPRDLNFSPKP